MPKSAKLTLLFFVGISVFGLLIVLTIALFPPKAEESLSWRRPLVGSLFALICASGIVAGLFPKKCSEVIDSDVTKKPADFHAEGSGFRGVVRGHHSACGRFSAHIVQIGSHTLCAACTGLVLGAILALVGTAFYFFGEWHIGEMGFAAVPIGVTGVALGFLQFEFRGFVRMTLNVLFVLGAFFVLIGIDDLTGDLFAEVFLIVLIIFWIFTRVMLSQWDHWKTCNACKSGCEIGKQRKVVLVSSPHSIERADND